MRVGVGVGEDLAKVGWSAEDDNRFFKETVGSGAWGGNVKIFSKEAFEFCNKGALVRVMGGLGWPDGMSMESMGNFFGYEGWRIASGDEGLDNISSLDVEIIRVTTDSLPPDGQRTGYVALGG